ncbi:MAG: helix-turn-helix transcriptional regulator [Clostridiales bacterium]|nr:helix-turn-helix transcriptional regulator [Clostridiales bacterium]
MKNSHFKKINLLSPECNDDLLFERGLFSISIADAFFLDMRDCDYPFTQPIDRHNLYELDMVIKGYCHFEFPAKKALTVTQGKFIIIPPFVKHKITFESNDSSRVKFLFTFISKDGANNFLTTAENILKNNYVFSYNEQMQSLLSFMIDMSTNMPSEYKASIFLYANAYIIEALRIVATEKIVKENETTKILNSATEYIALNASATLSVPDVADFVGISPKQLSRIFCKHIGISPGKYIKNCRISRISNFLIFSNLSISDIAETMAYPDYASFVNAFKRAKGCTPTQYRKKIKSNNATT